MVQPGDRIFVKGYGFLYFAKNMGKKIGKYSQKHFDHAKHSVTGTFKNHQKQQKQESQKLLQKIIQKRMKKKYLEKNTYHQN